MHVLRLVVAILLVAAGLTASKWAYFPRRPQWVYGQRAQILGIIAGPLLIFGGILMGIELTDLFWS